MNPLSFPRRVVLAPVRVPRNALPTVSTVPTVSLLAGVAVALAGVLGPRPVSGAVTSVTSGDSVQGSHSLNLISNGSFEQSGWTANGAGTGQASWVLTGTGSMLNGGLVSVPSGWTTLGGSQNYAVWGNDSSLSGTGLHGSATLPDGSLGVYMGNQSVLVSPAPAFGVTGEITFSSAPSFTHVPAVGYTPAFRIEQTVTGLDVNSTYLLDFWTSGEDAATGGFAGPGLLELNITGENPIYLATPYDPSDSLLGASQRYYIGFQPTASSVTFSFINHGHLLLTGIHSEGVLDDVILNLVSQGVAVPEPGTALAAAVLTLAAGRWGWLRRRGTGVAAG